MTWSPNYTWVCHKCRAANAAGTARCTTCGLGAMAGAGECAAAAEDEPAPRDGVQPMLSQNALMFFPEIIPAAFVVVISPLWAVSLLMHGQITAALLLVAGVGAFTCGFFASAREKQSLLAYVCMVGVLGVALLAHSLKT